MQNCSVFTSEDLLIRVVGVWPVFSFS